MRPFHSTHRIRFLRHRPRVHPTPGGTRVRAALVALGLLLASSATAQGISVPEGFYERPDRLWVIPVVFTPVDQLNSVPDPSHRGVTLGGAPLTAIVQSRWEAARANVFAQLRVVQAVYEDRLQDPNTGASRGSFGIASWNPASKQVEVLSPGDPDGRPYVYAAAREWEAYHGEDDPRLAIADELLRAFHCSRYNCPFVFLTFLAHPTSLWPNARGGNLNHGLNGGAGVALFPYSLAARAHLKPARFGYHPSAAHFVSTLTHELGHAFGLSHVWGAYAGSTHKNCAAIPTSEIPYSKYCSPSFMSYNAANHTQGCFANDLQGYCAYPGPGVATSVPGDFLPEDFRDLSLNDLALPDFDYDPDLEKPGWTLRERALRYSLPLPAHPELEVTSPQTAYKTQALHVMGLHTRPPTPGFAPFQHRGMWHSSNVGAGGEASITLHFPKAVKLSEVRVGTQYTHPSGSVMHRPVALEIQARCATLGAFTEIAFEETPLSETGIPFPAFESDTWRFRFTAGTSGYVVVRSLRLFDAVGGELFAALEPTAKTDYGEDLETSVSAVVGTQQHIEGYPALFDPPTSWYSGAVAPHAWASLEVTFPQSVNIRQIQVYSGHSGIEPSKSATWYHPAEAVWVEKKTSKGFEKVGSAELQGPQGHLFLPPGHSARSWNIAFRTGASGHALIRGLRFFDDLGNEWFPPSERPALYTNYGETYWSAVSNLQREPSETIPGVDLPFDASRMWHSGKVDSHGWVSLVLEFPEAIALSCLQVSSQHSGAFHEAKGLFIEQREPGGFAFLFEGFTMGPDALHCLPGTPPAKVWRLAFKTGESGYAVLRGLEFFDAEGNIVYP